MINTAKSLWHYRHFIRSAIVSEFKGRFARSALGGFWFIINPLAQAAIFAVVLSEVLRAKKPNINNDAAYAIYLMAGLAAWGLFSEILNRCTNVFIEFSSALKKISFPRLCLPVIVGGSALLNHVILLAAMVVVFAFFSHAPNTAWLVLPIGAALLALMAFGLGITLGVVNVFSRDIGQVMGIVVQLWFWLTPIVYTRDTVPKKFQWFLDFNPVVPMVRLYQDVVLLGQLPLWPSLLMPTLVSLVLAAFALLVFRRASPDIVDAL